MKVQKAIKDILQPLYALSFEVFVEAKKRFDSLGEGHPKEDVVGSSLADDVIQGLFRDWGEIISERSKKIGTRVVRDYSLSIALEAWIFCRKNIIQNKEQIQGVPIIWAPLDDFFKQFVDEVQLEVLTEMIDEGKESISSGSKALLELENSLKELHEEDDDTKIE